MGFSKPFAKPFANPFAEPFGNKGGGSNPNAGYILYDRFGVALPAGSVNGSKADTGQARTVTDTNSKLSITGGVASFATGGVGIGDPGLWYPVVTRVLGRILKTTVVLTNTSASAVFGGDTNQSGGVTYSIRFAAAGVLQIQNQGGSSVSVAVYTATTYELMIVQRTLGTFYMIKGGAFTFWTLLWHQLVDSGDNFPAITANGTASVFTADDVKVPIATYIPQPLAYDTFTR